MASLTPIDYGALTDEQITDIGLDAAAVAFANDVVAGLTNGDSLILVVGIKTLNGWTEWGRRSFGPDAAQFEINVDSEQGKLATSLQFGKDSVHAFQNYGDQIPKGPQRYTGGVYHVARAETKRGWHSMVFAGAASGVQGHLDMAVTYSALTRMGAAWVLREIAHYGAP